MNLPLEGDSRTHSRKPAARRALALLALVASLSAAILGCARDRGGVASADSDDETYVFAAASLSAVLQQIGSSWQASGGKAPSFNFAGSNELSRQILAGAPADLFLSADRAQVDKIVEAGLAQPGDVTEILANELVVIGAEPGRPALTSPSDLLEVERLSLADPQGVPAGVYAQQWLEALGLWEQLEGRVVPALDVRAALQAVASGNVEAGIVYATDASAPGASGKVRVLWRVSATDPASPKVRYYLCLLSSHDAAAGELAEFLRGDQAAALFSQAGFQPLTSER